MEIRLGKYRITRRNLIVSFFFVFIIFNHFFGYVGHFGYDDLHYAELANNFKNGEFDASDHYSHRLSVIFTTAFSYLLFGVNDFASSLPALLLSTGVLLLLVDILKHESDEILMIALSLLFFSNSFLFYSDKLMPDMYVAFAVFLSVYTYQKVRFHKTDKSFRYAILFSAALLFGFMAKGSIILILPFLIYMVTTDLILNRMKKFWLHSILSGIGLGLLYLIGMWIFTGSAFSRFEAIEGNSYLSLCSYGEQPVEMLLDRIGIGFYQLLFHQGILISLVFVVVFLINRMGLDIWRCDTPFSFFLVASILLVISANFMSISLTSYNPMCLDMRHYLYLFPVLAIPASRIIYHFSLRRHLGITSLIVLFSIILISELLNDTKYVEVYALLLFLFAIKFFIPTLIKRPFQFAVIFTAITSIIPFQSWNYAHQVGYHAQKSTVQKYLRQYENTIFVTDEIQERLGNYYMAFKSLNGNEFRSFKNFSWDDSGKNKKILYNAYTSYIGETEFPFYAEVLINDKNLITRDLYAGISLYAFDYFPFYSVINTYENDFEIIDKDYWDNSNTIEAESKEGSISTVNQFNIFSSIFTLDTLVYDKLQRDAIVHCSFDIKLEALCSPRLELVFEEGGAEYHREERLFDQHLKSVGAWYSINQEVYVPNNLIRPNSKLSIYIWNPQDKTVLLDNFKIELKTLKNR